eukprot:m.71246 g.71246  ORF g.71246 m.71246 type:complete len:124 (-) comp12934_c0_seq3:18-389(-)
MDTHTHAHTPKRPGTHEQWLETGKSSCPVCKGSVSKDTVTPVFTGSDNVDPRTKKHPPRPQAQRVPAPEPERGFPNFQFGVFGFPFLGGAFTIGRNGPVADQEMARHIFLAFLVMILFSIFFG